MGTGTQEVGSWQGVGAMAAHLLRGGLLGCLLSLTVQSKGLAVLALGLASLFISLCGLGPRTSGLSSLLVSFSI